MRSVRVKSLTIENFKSFTDETTIEFSDKEGLIFFGGVNEVEPRLGANGAGKSSLWDALIWLLYGKTARGNIASEIVSWGQKRPRVQAILEINGELFWLERVGSPNKILTIDVGADEPYPLEQRDVDIAIGLTYRRFLQSVIFGQMVPLFLDLSIPQRGELLDEVMDLGLWLRASERASKQVVTFKAEAQKQANDVRALKGEMAGLEDIDALRRQVDEWENLKQDQIFSEIKKVEEYEAQLEGAKAEKTKFEARMQVVVKGLGLSESELKERQRKVSVASKLEYKSRSLIPELEQERKFFAEHLKLGDGACPQCGQMMTVAMLRRNVDAIDKRIKETVAENIKLKSEHDRLQKIYSDFRADNDRLLSEQRQCLQAIASVSERIKFLERSIDDAAARIERIHAAQENPHAKRLERALERSKTLTERIDQHGEAEAVALAQAAHAEYWKQAFKRVRLFLVQRVLDTFEIETANAASVLGLPDWKIKYATEVETKSGSMKAGIQVLVQSPLAAAPWEVWSGGEGQRIKLAVSLGMASMIQRNAGVDFKFEVYDEPAAWLSSEGIEDLLECLRYRAQITKKAVWIIDPRGFNFGGFVEHWLATKTHTGTRIERVSVMI